MITREMIRAVRDHFNTGDFVCMRMKVYGRRKTISGRVYGKYDDYVVIETDHGYREAVRWADMIMEGRKYDI